MSIKHIFLDMDGVLTDFVSAALRVHDRNEALDAWPPGERDIPKVLGISRGEYWRKIDAQGVDFWSQLEAYSWVPLLIDEVQQFAPWSILTAPSLAPHSSQGKIIWLRNYFPKVKGRAFSDFLIGNQKHLLAQPGHILIDDAEANVDAFQAAGGHAILFPAIWNRNYQVENPVAYVREQLEAMV